MSNAFTSFINHYIEQNRARFTQLSDAIWDHPETRFEETFSAGLLADALEQEGFTVERGWAILIPHLLPALAPAPL